MKKNIEETMNELAELKNMMDELKDEIDTLQDEIKAYMKDNEIDEILTTDGKKATWREVISNRFDSTAFKKDFADIYREYTKQTTCKRFTFNA